MIFTIAFTINLAGLPIESPPEEMKRRIAQPIASGEGLQEFLRVGVPRAGPRIPQRELMPESGGSSTLLGEFVAVLDPPITKAGNACQAAKLPASNAPSVRLTAKDDPQGLVLQTVQFLVKIVS